MDNNLYELENEMIFLQDGQINFQKTIEAIKAEIEKIKLSLATAKIVGLIGPLSNYVNTFLWIL